MTQDKITPIKNTKIKMPNLRFFKKTKMAHKKIGQKEKSNNPRASTPSKKLRAKNT